MSYTKLFFARLIPFFRLKENQVDQARLHAKILEVEALVYAVREMMVEKGICTREELIQKYDEGLKTLDLGILGGQAKDDPSL